MKKFLFSFALISVFGLLSSVYSVSADVVCTPIYGGGQTCQQVGPVTISKMVSNPKTGAFVNSLGQNDDKFAPDQSIAFQLTIANTGSTTLSKVTVNDTFPKEITGISGPGSVSGNTVTFDETNLNPGESRTRTVSGKIVSANRLSDQSIICVINQASVTSDSQTNQSNVQFCIQKPAAGAVAPTAAPTTKGGLKVFPAPQPTINPPTGPETLPLILLIPTGILGTLIRRLKINA